jgi:hypothetical protein
VVTETEDVPSGAATTHTPPCPDGLEPVSGGVQTGAAATTVGQSYPNVAANGWTTSAANDPSLPTLKFTFYSICETPA